MKQEVTCLLYTSQVTGMVLSGAGLGAAAWVFLAGQLFKVTDYKNCYRIFSCLVLVIGLLAVLLLIKSPEQMGQKPLEMCIRDRQTKVRINAIQT